MEKKKQNKFFTEDIYQSQIALHVNKDVLRRIYRDNISPDDKLPVEFFFVSNEIDNVLDLQSHLKEHFKDYTSLKVQPYEDNFEISGTTSPIKMDLESINQWNQMMWDLGYEFDCKLDGWQVGT